MSSRGRRALRDSGISTATASSASAITGTLIRNTEPHQKWVSSQPPRIGPIGNATKVAPTVIVIAVRRSSSENSTGSTDSDSGMMKAAPSPSTARAAISRSAEEAYAQASEATPNTSSAPSSSFLRPKRSPSSPAGSSIAASTRL